MTRMSPLATEVDHVICKASDAEGLFRFFTDTLQWPIASNYKVIVPGVFASGAASVGNLHFECARVGPGSRMSEPPPGRAAFGGLCVDAYKGFDPQLLEQRGLAYDIIAPNAADGKPMFTNYRFDALRNPDSQVSLTVYRETFDPIARKRSLASDLSARKGGPLGILGAVEIAMGATEPADANMTWRRLLGEPMAPGQWRLSQDDPTLAVVESPHDGRIVQVALTVRSLQVAVDFLRVHEALRVGPDGACFIQPPNSEGLTIRIVGPL